MDMWEPLSFEGLKTVSLYERPSKVSVESFSKRWKPGGSLADFLAILPNILAGEEFMWALKLVAEAARKKRTIVLGMGAHPVKVGLGPLIVQAMECNILTGLSVNGAAVIHDVEVALSGRTSEDVEAHLQDGSFGAVDETARFIHEALKESEDGPLGFGAAVGRKIVEERLPFREYSLFANAFRLKKPLTVHVAIGTDIVHIHPLMNGALTGRFSYRDFQIFCRLVSTLEGGVYLNMGSAVIMPEVFLKAVSVVRNLGYPVEHITTINLDFQHQYRSRKNVVERPTKPHGRGFYFTGHHEIMWPLFFASLMEILR